MARQIARAIEIDDYRFVTTTVECKKLIAVIDAKSISSLMHTLDDYLVCLGLAENIVRVGGNPRIPHGV